LLCTSDFWHPRHSAVPCIPWTLMCMKYKLLIHLGLQSSQRCLLQTTVFVPGAHWEAYGCGSLPPHNLVSDSANPRYVSDPLPQSFVGSS
jgi:hypothetical protein